MTHYIELKEDGFGKLEGKTIREVIRYDDDEIGVWFTDDSVIYFETKGEHKVYIMGQFDAQL